MKLPKKYLFLVVAIGVLFAAACSEKGKEPFRDAPQGPNRNSGPADVIEMPDGFNNAATKCDHGNRLYVIYHGDDNRGAIAVVANDPTCKGVG